MIRYFVETAKLIIEILSPPESHNILVLLTNRHYKILTRSHLTDIKDRWEWDINAQAFIEARLSGRLFFVDLNNRHLR